MAILSNSDDTAELDASEQELQISGLEDAFGFGSNEFIRFSDEIDSTCSTPYVSAPSSPGRGLTGPDGYFFSAPASPMHFVLTPADSVFSPSESSAVSGSFDFEFSSKVSPNGSSRTGAMSSADELFANGKIRPSKLSPHWLRPRVLVPLVDLNEEECEKRDESVTRGRDLKSRNRSLNRKARSMSPMRIAQFRLREGEDDLGEERDPESKPEDSPSISTAPSLSASCSRSSSSGRNSKKWIFLKEFLSRSKSEGTGHNREKFWSSISFSPSKEKKLSSPSLTPSSSRDEKSKIYSEARKQKSKKRSPPEKRSTSGGKLANGVAKRSFTPSAHELLYTANRAQAEEMKKKTFLPYRQGLLGCIGFSSKGYGAFNGLTRTLKPVPSR